VLAEMFQDIRTVTTLFNDVTPTVSKYWEGPGMPDPACSPLMSGSLWWDHCDPSRVMMVAAWLAPAPLCPCVVLACLDASPSSDGPRCSARTLSPGSRDDDLHQLRDRVLLVRRR